MTDTHRLGMGPLSESFEIFYKWFLPAYYKKHLWSLINRTIKDPSLSEITSSKLEVILQLVTTTLVAVKLSWKISTLNFEMD